MGHTKPRAGITLAELGELCTPAEMAGFLGTSTQTIYNMIGRGDITAIKVGRCVRVCVDQSLQMLGLNRNGGGRNGNAS